MLDNEKVCLMTKIAVYEKSKGKQDIMRAQYHQKDYISLNNFKMQLSVTFALIILFSIEFSSIVMDSSVTATTTLLIGIGVKYLLIWLLFMIGYTILSTINNKKEYLESKHRIEEYETLLNDLDKIQ
ncbi:MAG: hypothetical protein CVU84_07540 [Firmicutes bacterium HGW-Firmicutes-1]|jgi:hypothetical protein|nr:MAG: hypothetical protein CVU84_07540 [Firmicutes bacterium HGW-Firmicutes-1]